MTVQDHFIVAIGTFNLDENQKINTQYSYHRYYDLLQNRFNELNLIQLIKFNTWGRLVGNVWKESCLDHLHTNDSTSISNISTITPIMGDHKIITANLGDLKPLPKISERRSWKSYSKAGLIELLNKDYKVVRNLLVNRFQILNNKIDYSWFNASFESFKIKCKSLML